ncbi:serine protease inhibitor Kazal-type 4-like [Phodopus roborovskii]|uniref:Spink4 protein n=1 Tax=Phodopus roborovskii TaxID=109678 RepID=A0AAU9ZDK7_PHORO|nr:serine protease inhibitor Kazal-type 4 [Phodopus roborovskii]XP_051045376.1 serine protease inhibitor Kazal-type 4-like [Phodopus roborovskii]CAH6790252.1 Spink4 [Phodopus roborovskii]
MAMHLWMVTLTLAALLAMDSGGQVSAGKLVFSRMPICEHMAASPKCPQTPKLICGTDGVTYKNECYLCVTRIKTKKDIQIMKDGKC